MSRVVELLCSRRTPQVAVLALMSFGFAGCSADTQTRLSQNSFSNPFSSQPETTASVATPTPQVERRELPQLRVRSRNISLQPCRRRLQHRKLILPPWRIRRRARGCILFAADPPADRNHGQRRAAFDCRNPCAGREPAPPSSSAPATPWTPWRTDTA